jgi:hypothetical protein
MQLNNKQKGPGRTQGRKKDEREKGEKTKEKYSNKFRLMEYPKMSLVF